MQLTKLSLSGFKSFVDNTDVDIPPGLTGIIGPNGCGKSNTVEALRWVMGETSARKLRGGGMDDVIFAGTRSRPARNIAEVKLILDNHARTAPPQFNDADIIEIRRRIERGSGSDYTLNNKPVRARDIQTLLMDVAAGASSASMISQGRVAAIVNAKPQERRQILEEAAGVSGLRARRREAELKLQAAETNLTRVDDVVQGLEGQLATLKKQSRQAVRYRELSEKIQRLDGLYLRQEYLRVLSEWQDATAAQHTADSAIAEATTKVAQASTEEADATASMPILREEAVRTGAALQRLKIEDENLASEESRAAQRLMQIAVAQNETQSDIQHQEREKTEAETTNTLLQSELDQLIEAENNNAEITAEAAVKLHEANDAHQAAAKEYDARRQQMMETETQRRNAEQQKEKATTRFTNLENEANAIATRLEALAETLDNDQTLITAETAHGEAREARDAAQQHVDQQNELRAETEKNLLELRASESRAREQLATVQGELNALEKLLSSDHDHDEAVIEQLSVPQGLENALAVALGEAARASLDKNHASYWLALPELNAPALPGGLPRLSAEMDAPAELNRVLQYVGIAPDAETAQRLAAELQPGQMIVTRDGGLWRWDGYCMQPGAMTASARRMQQRNRSKELSTLAAEQKENLNLATSSRESAERVFADIDASLRRAQSEFQGAQRRLEDAQSAITAAREAQSSARQEQAMLRELARKNADTQAEVQTEITRAAEILSGLADAETLQIAADAARNILDAAFSTMREAQVAHDHLEYQANARAKRRSEITEQQTQWQLRADRAAQRLAELHERAEVQAREHAELMQKPTEIRELRAALLQQLQDAEGIQQQAVQALQDAENILREKTAALKEAESALADAREARIKLDTNMALAEHKQQELDAKAEALVNVRAKDLADHFNFNEAEMARDVDDVRGELERSMRSREAIGPVNLRADIEAQELEAQLETVATEKNELVAAIARLRGGIGHLNREARERMREAFNTVSVHFTELFTRLFSGGTAELKLVDSDDPLEAGLEIVAQPPGKKLQSLQLLSGGEQALTALSLIFAMFRANPAPICVLDEVDAPLDDANVDRFCTLLEEMAKSNYTRFLVITHHRLTMARMHRLYGVTMREPGVSQMVSVDLNTAAEMVERQAA